MEDFFYAGGLPALLHRAGRPARRHRAHREREDVGGQHRRGEGVQRRRDPVPGQPAGRLGDVGGVARQPGPGRRGDQTRGRRGSGCTATPGRRWCSPTTTTWPPGSTTPDLDITADSVIVLQCAGPQGAPGMPEWGQLPIPKKLLEQGVRDMVRISDARMSRHQLRRLRAARGPRVPHRRPAGPGPRRRPHRARRRRPANSTCTSPTRNWTSAAPTGNNPRPKYARGYGALYLQHITQADQGCDFDFLEAGAPTPEPEIH